MTKLKCSCLCSSPLLRAKYNPAMNTIVSTRTWGDCDPSRPLLHKISSSRSEMGSPFLATVAIPGSCFSLFISASRVFLKDVNSGFWKKSAHGLMSRTHRRIAQQSCIVQTIWGDTVSRLCGELLGQTDKASHSAQLLGK